jgi:D-amino peptidase
MIVWICTDMEGLAGVDSYDQCYDPDDNAPRYRHACEQLTAEVNAAVAGCFDAGATEVRVLEGHGRNGNKGFIVDKRDPRVKKVWIASRTPLRWEGLDESVKAIAVIGQHAMAGTIHGFLDHTQAPKTVCRLMFNGVEHGEMSQMALYAGAHGAPLAYASGDEALCAETRRLFPHAGTTPTKRGTGWATCELYPPEQVRANIRRDIAASLKRVKPGDAWKLPSPVRVSLEFAWSEHADYYATLPGVRRTHARVVEWDMKDPRDAFAWPAPA